MLFHMVLYAMPGAGGPPVPSSLSRDELKEIANVIETRILKPVIENVTELATRTGWQPEPIVIGAGIRSKRSLPIVWPIDWTSRPSLDLILVGPYRISTSGKVTQGSTPSIGVVFAAAWETGGIKLVADMTDGLINLANKIHEQILAAGRALDEDNEIIEAYNRVQSVMTIERLAGKDEV